MKKLFFIIAFFLIAAAFINQSFASRALTVVDDLSHKKGTIGTYRALIIGIQNYNDPKIPDLQTPLNDAKAIAEILQTKYGFIVDSLLDSAATKKAMYRKLRDLSSKSKDEDSVLIYYAGHGDFDRQYDDGWWIPVDAKGGEPVTYLDNTQIQKAMRSMKAKHVLLISDSCYSGTLFGQVRAMPAVINDKYYLSLYNEKSRWGMTSGNKTPVSDTGSGGHSVFAYQLIKKLKDNNMPFITTQEVYTDIAPIIANNSEQTPMCRPIKGTGDMGGEFIFVSNGLTNQYQPNKISGPQIAIPENRKISYEDIIKAGENKGKIKSQWKSWQSDKEAEYVQVQSLDKNPDLDMPLKKEVWLRFLSGVSQDNPFSTRDDEMRTYAKQRIEYWENELSGKNKLVKQETKSEQKRKEQDRLKLEVEKTNKPEKIKLASINPNDKKPKIVARDSHYVKYDTGVVYDTKTGLEWRVGPNKSISFNKSKSWVANLTLDDKGWGLPSIDQLNTLYNKNYSPKNFTPLLETSGKKVWSLEYSALGSDYKWYFNFYYGRKERSDKIPSWIRVFAVRNSKNQSIITEHKKSKKEKLVRLASINQTDKKAEIIARDGQYVKYENGIVYDKNTGLEWYTEPDKKTDWYKAYSWVTNLDLEGGGWRMPSINELKLLYTKEPEYKKITSLLLINGGAVFTNNDAYLGSPTRTSIIDFNNGKITTHYISSSRTAMAFAVRKKK